MARIETDYLIVGAGAMGMAYADVLVRETQARIVIVDKQDKPGGHWNHAYPFVRLHQPSSFYGVNSRSLGSGRVDQVGGNRGLGELASKGEILDYFESVLRHDMLPTGRVRYFPQSDYLGDGRFRARATGEVSQVAARKIVDATYMKVKVPQTTPPAFEVADGVDCAPPNALGALERSYDAFVVLGAGKTGFDALLYLLELGVSPDKIIWIAPRDSWLLNRAHFQPGRVVAGFLPQIAAIAASTSLEDLFRRVEATNGLLRIHRDREPTMFRCATMSELELESLRKIDNVVRLGRVTTLKPGRIELEGGGVDVPMNALYVNCTADGLEKLPARPVFDGDRTPLQAVRGCQQVFCAAFIAHVETMDRPEAEKNAICAVDPHPDDALDYLNIVKSWFGSELRWSGDPELFAWLSASRLSGLSEEFGALLAGDGPLPPQEALEVAQTALAKIDEYLAAAGP